MNIKTTYVNTPDNDPSPIRRSNYASGQANASAATEFVSRFDENAGDTKTVVIPSSGACTHQPSKICVGWVVAVKGPLQGQSFALYLGQNHVGSESRNDIVIAKNLDPGISGYNHVNIEYDQKINKYFVSRGNEGHSLAYINGNRLSGGQECELTRGDTIELSDLTVLRFVPFCDDQFTWAMVQLTTKS